MTMIDRVFQVTDGVPGYGNPGHRLVVSTAHLKALADESPIEHSLLGRVPVDTLRIFDYPIRVDETVTEMRLEPIEPARIDVRKVAVYQPIADGTCGGCGQPTLYNLAIQHIEHEEPNPDCPGPWVKVQRTPEEAARIAAAKAEHAATVRALQLRHAWLLEHAPHPVLTALLDAHGPRGEERFPTCSACPEVNSQYGDSDPENWPCGVWTFISDRLEGA